MAQYYNVVTKPNGTLTLEDIQQICGLDGQSVQLIVEDIDNSSNVLSPQLLLATAPATEHNTDQSIITPSTINLGTQLTTTQLDSRQSVYIIKTADSPIQQNIFTKLEANNTATVSKDQINVCYTPVQTEWVSTEENQAIEVIVQKDIPLVENFVASLVENQQQNTTAKITSGNVLVQNTSDKKITRLVPINQRHSVGGTSGTILRTSLQGQNSSPGKVCKMRRNSNVNNPNVSLVARQRAGVSTNQVLTTPRGPQARPPIHQDSLQQNNLIFPKNSPKSTAQYAQLSERIKNISSKQRQRANNEEQEQQRLLQQKQQQQLQVMAVTPTPRTSQTTQGQVQTNQVQKRASMGNLVNRPQHQLQQQQQKLQQLQQQQQLTQLQQQQLQQRHAANTVMSTAQQSRQAVVEEEPMDIDACENEQFERLSQHNSTSKSDPEENSSESVAYLQQEIDDPSTSIVQQQITGNEAKMLVILENGEQRLITFEVPKEDCTVQDLLEQANIFSSQEPRVSLVSDQALGINYIVDVTPKSSHEDELYETESIVSEPKTPVKSTAGTVASHGTISPRVPKYISGKLAVCPHCGVSAADFNHCMRCKRKLPENVKTVSISSNSPKKENVNSNDTFYTKRNELSGQKLEPSAKRGRGALTRGRGITRSRQIREPECLTISSDEEDDSKKQKSSDDKNKTSLHNSCEESETILEKEPVITNTSVRNTAVPTSAIGGGREIGPMLDPSQLSTYLECRTVRIGSYKYIPQNKIYLSADGLKLEVPLLEDDKNFITLDIKFENLVKVLIHFAKSMPVLFFYTTVSTGLRIRDLLGMQDPKGPYFDPAGKDQTHKRITLLPEKIADDSKLILKTIFRPIFEELSTKEANDVLVKASPKAVQTPIAAKKVGSGNSSNSNGVIQTITVYPAPPSKGGIAINTEDFICLGEDQFLNDVIIDFYLKYLTLEVLSKRDSERTHVFSSYFYKRLTSPHTQLSESQEGLSAAAKRHARVQKWTKNVNIFEKDFVVIPINEHAHWFLAIICFPGLVGTVAPKVEVKSENPKSHDKKKKETKKDPAVTIGSTTITPVNTITIDTNDDGSERDEAEGDDDEMESDSDEDDESDSKSEQASSSSTATPQQPDTKDEVNKVPCILIFDSLAGASRARVVATLRDYLSCEYKAKMGKEKIFSKDTIKGSCPKVPQQSNFTDCGLYVLQYVESFFKAPILDYTLPIKTLKNWFEEIVVTRKREDLAILLTQLVKKTKGDKVINLPILTFPTHEGKMKPQKAESQVETKVTKMEVDIKKKTNEAGENKSNATTPAAEGSESSSESSSKSGTSKVPTSVNQTASTTDGSIVVQKEPVIAPVLRSAAETMTLLKAKRIPRLQKTDISEDKTAAKRHKGDSLDSCK